MDDLTTPPVLNTGSTQVDSWSMPPQESQLSTGLALQCPACGLRLPTSAALCPACQQPLSLETRSVPEAPPWPQQPWPWPWSLRQLGRRQDGWSRLVPHGAGRAAEVRNWFGQRLVQRELPGIGYDHRRLTARGIVGRRREYHLLRGRHGVSVAVETVPQGRDLYVAWAVYTRHVWRGWVIVGLLGLVVWLSLGGEGIFPNLGLWLVPRFAGWGLLVLIGTGLLGRLLRGDPWLLFRTDLDDVESSEAQALIHAVDQSLRQAITAVGLDLEVNELDEVLEAQQVRRII